MTILMPNARINNVEIEIFVVNYIEKYANLKAYQTVIEQIASQMEPSEIFSLWLSRAGFHLIKQFGRTFLCADPENNILNMSCYQISQKYFYYGPGGWGARRDAAAKTIEIEIVINILHRKACEALNLPVPFEVLKPFLLEPLNTPVPKGLEACRYKIIVPKIIVPIDKFRPNAAYEVYYFEFINEAKEFLEFLELQLKQNKKAEMRVIE